MGDYRYKAFISYSHADEKWAGWLQRALEAYRPPPRLAGRAASDPPPRLTPIFRDREDLPAAGCLNAEIRKALAESEFLVVICSPSAARSLWVNEEIKLFKSQHAADRVLALIVDGDPAAADDPDRQCFPQALRFMVDAGGEVTTTPIEPLAADARPAADGKQQALLKLAAGLLGVRLDELVRRDAQRRMQRTRIVAASGFAVAAVMGMLSLYAFDRNREAQRMRVESETLIDFMLTNLRDRLEPVGRLDILESVGVEAMNYYSRQNLRTLDGDSLNRRAKAVRLLGNIEHARRNFDKALDAYLAAEKTTGEQLRRAPDNPQRIFDHAQNVFYVGEIARLRDDMATCESRYLEYYGLAQRLIHLDSENTKWRLEIAYATSNLGVLEYEKRNFAKSVDYFTQTIAARRTLYLEDPTNEKIAFAYAYALSWLALAEIKDGRYRDSIGTIADQLKIYDPMIQSDPENFKVLTSVMSAQQRIGESYLFLGDIDSARIFAQTAEKVADRLLARDKENSNWISSAGFNQNLRSQLAVQSGDISQALAAANAAIGHARNVYERDTTSGGGAAALIAALASRLRVPDALESRQPVYDELSRMLGEFDAVDLLRLDSLGAGYSALTAFALERGDQDAAAHNRKEGLKLLTPHEDRLTIPALISLAELRLSSGDTAAARKITARLAERGIRHPAAVDLQKRLEPSGGE